MRSMVKSIKTILVTLALIFSVSMYAQDMTEASKAFNEGAAAQQEGNLELAIEKFETVLDITTTLYEEEEDEAAEEMMYKTQEYVPKLYYKLAKTQLANKEIAKGTETAYTTKEVAENYGDSETADKAAKLIVQAHYKIAGSKYKGGDNEAALAELDKALAVNPDYAKAYYLQCAVYKKAGDNAALKESALKGVEAAKKSNDASTEGKIKKLAGGHFLKEGNEAKGASKYDEALELLNASAEIDGSNSTTLYLIANIYNQQNKYDDAIAAANKAIEVETGDDEAKAKIYMEIGNAEAAKGNTSAACSAYNNAKYGAYAELATYKIEHELKCE